MKTLKKMIFKLLSQTLSMKEFETWLYQDEFIKSQILRNEMIFELVNINLRSKHAFEELTDFCFNHFDKEECLIQIVKYNCEILLENKTNKVIENFFRNVCYFYDWESDYSIISQIYYLEEDWQMTDEGYIEKQKLEKELFDYAASFLTQLQGLKVEESIELFRNGIELIEESSENSIDGIIKNKKWFQCWK